MFETGINVWLQSTGSGAATALLVGVTLLGYLPAYVAAIVTFAFAFRLRLGLAVLGAVLLTGVATEAAKEMVALPRPDQVDDRLMRTFASDGEAVVSRGGAPGFWSLPAAAAIEEVRARGHGNYGFPSGHVSAATAFFVCVGWFLRSRRVYALGAAWVGLMALSRMYLGRHFLADVLGGLVIGLLVSTAWIRLGPALDPPAGGWPDRRAVRRLWLLSLGLLVLTPFWPPLAPRYMGALAGLAGAYTTVLVTGAPLDGGTAGRRVSRVLLALFVFAATLGAGERVLALAEQSGARLPELLVAAVVTVSTMAGTIVLCRRLGWYEA